MAKKKTTKPKKEKAVVEVAEDDDFEPVTKPKKKSAADDEDEDDGKPRARNDVYVGLTLLTMLILIGAAVLLYFDQEDLKNGPNAGFNPPTVTAGALGVRSAGKQ